MAAGLHHLASTHFEANLRRMAMGSDAHPPQRLDDLPQYLLGARVVSGEAGLEFGGAIDERLRGRLGGLRLEQAVDVGVELHVLAGGGAGGGTGPGIGPGQGPGTGPGAGGGGQGGTIRPPELRDLAFPFDTPPKELRGASLAVTFWVRVDGQVDRYEVEPAIDDRDYARKFDEVIRAFRFTPARAPDGSKVAGTTTVTFTLPGKRNS